MPRREQRAAAAALVELDDVRDRLTDVLADQRTPDAAYLREELKRAMGELEALGQRLENEIASGTGLSIEAAARYIGVSAQTVRTWTARGVCKPMQATKPTQIERESARRVHRALAQLREHGQNRDWLSALIDMLHDTADARSATVRKGLEELARGETEAA
jgi:DNA-binding transcriptional MerR regulator